MHDYLLIFAVVALSTFDGAGSICLNPMTNGDLYYCKEKNITCLQCTPNTFYSETCKIEKTGSDCQPCPPGTRNPKPYHLDRHCQEKKLDADRATDDTCIHPKVNGDTFHCLDTRIICIMCKKDTRYVGPCTENYTPAKCVPCEPGTWNPIEFHIDKDCVPKNPNDDAGIQSPEDFRLPQDWQRKNVKKVTVRASDNNQGIRLLINPLVYLVLLLFTFFFTT